MKETVYGVGKQRSHTGRVLVAVTAGLLVLEVAALLRRGDDIPTISNEVGRAVEVHPMVAGGAGVVCGHWFTRFFSWVGNVRVTLPWSLGVLLGGVGWKLRQR